MNIYQQTLIQQHPKPTLTLHKILGKTVIELPANKNNIIVDASPFKSGVYFVELKTINGLNNIKLIKL
jgi:hypothetical protein